MTQRKSSLPRATTSSISPSFIAGDVSRMIAFYREKLGFEVTYQQPAQDPFFAILRRDGAQLFFKSERGIAPQPNHTRHEHVRWDAYVNTEDPDTLAAEFSERGVAFSSTLKDTHDGLRGFEITDPDGYVLFFGRPR
jgi:catechol 2,3-dioxygenase-like lactoylglutathione lyase family enzyme